MILPSVFPCQFWFCGKAVVEPKELVGQIKGRVNCGNSGKRSLERNVTEIEGNNNHFPSNVRWIIAFD
jgi:hypothetical protein